MPPSRAGVFVVSIFLPIVATITVALRFILRRNKKAIGSDDWTIAVALFFTWAMAIILIVGAAISSFGTHVSIDPITGKELFTHESLKEVINSIKLLYAFYLAMILALSSVKLSILFFYRRIFVGRTFKILSLTLGVFVVVWGITFFFATVFQCGSNPAYWWTSQYTSKYDCSKTAWLELGFAVTDVFVDMFILAIPIPLIWNLKMSTRRKIGLIAVFLLGILSTAGAITRMVIHILAIYITTEGSRDILGEQTDIVVWSLVEAGVAVIAACLPSLRALVGDRSTESIFRSVRSIFSLNSLDSRSRQRHHELGDAAFSTEQASRERVIQRYPSSDSHPTYESTIVEAKTGGSEVHDS